MSLPQNPLNRFRTYSYAHLLVIADSVESAMLLNNANNLSEVINVTAQVGNTFASSINGGNVVILMNGLQDAHYIMTELKWESITGIPGIDSTDNFTTMATEGSFTIEEPKGVKFLNNVKDAYTALAADPTACVWMIKTIFVGYHWDTTSPEYITNINPLIFNVIDLKSDFSNKGGIYNISFININNGTGKLGQLRNISETLSINLSKKNTLPDAIRKLNENITSRYDLYFKSISSTVEAVGAIPKRVEYEIKLHSHYDDSYIVTDIQGQNTQEGLPDSGVLLNFAKDINIENAIKKIMKATKKVKEDAAGINGEKFAYKIRSILYSTKDIHKVIYYIDRFKLPFANILQEAASNGESAVIKQNTVEFDYIFSGKNTDIIDFSMKIEMGMVFFQALVNNNNIGTQKDFFNGNANTTNVLGNKNTVTVNNTKSVDGKLPIQEPKMPVFFSTIVKNPESKNSYSPKESSEFQALLNRQAAIESLNAKIKIHGNPRLMDSTSKIPMGFTDDELSPVENGGDDGEPIFPHWERIPALAKINIFMPESADNDFGLKEKFWYDGLYYVFSVTNEFASGKFTQVLDMISLPNPEENSEKLQTTDNQNTKKGKQQVKSSPNGTSGEQDLEIVKNTEENAIQFVIDTHSTKNINSLKAL